MYYINNMEQTYYINPVCFIMVLRYNKIIFFPAPENLSYKYYREKYLGYCYVYIYGNSYLEILFLHLPQFL